MATNLTLTFGLVAVPVKKETATIKAQSMTTLCVGQPGKDEHEPKPIRKPTVCDACGDVTDPTALRKGLKSGKTITLVDAEELAQAKKEFTADYKGKLDMVPHPSEEFLAATAMGETLHWLTPASAEAANYYQLLARMVREHPELSFVGLHTPSSVASMYLLRVREDVLMLEQRVRGGQIKPAPSVGGVADDALYNMLTTTLGQFVTPYDAESYEDHYANAVAEMVARGSQVELTDPGAAQGTPVQMLPKEDLMEQLRKLKEAS